MGQKDCTGRMCARQLLGVKRTPETAQLGMLFRSTVTDPSRGASRPAHASATRLPSRLESPWRPPGRPRLSPRSPGRTRPIPSRSASCPAGPPARGRVLASLASNPPSWVAVPEKTAQRRQADLRRARIFWKDEKGRVVDFCTLRHSCVACLMRAGVSVKIVQVLVRHSTITLTLDRSRRKMSEVPWMAQKKLRKLMSSPRRNAEQAPNPRCRETTPHAGISIASSFMTTGLLISSMLGMRGFAEWNPDSSQCPP